MVPFSLLEPKFRDLAVHTSNVIFALIDVPRTLLGTRLELADREILHLLELSESILQVVYPLAWALVTEHQIDSLRSQYSRYLSQCSQHFPQIVLRTEDTIQHRFVYHHIKALILFLHLRYVQHFEHPCLSVPFLGSLLLLLDSLFRDVGTCDIGVSTFEQMISKVRGPTANVENPGFFRGDVCFEDLLQLRVRVQPIKLLSRAFLVPLFPIHLVAIIYRHFSAHLFYYLKWIYSIFQFICMFMFIFQSWSRFLLGASHTSGTYKSGSHNCLFHSRAQSRFFHQAICK